MEKLTKVCTKCPEKGEQSIEQFQVIKGKCRRGVCKKCRSKSLKKDSDRPVEYNRERYRKRREKMSGTYMKDLIRKHCKELKGTDITQEMVQLQREAVQIYRQLKQTI